MSSSPVRPGSSAGLKQSALSPNETLAQSFALIAPVAAPLLSVPVVFASTGAGTWLAFVIATLTVLLVALNINHFARLSGSPGSLYSYISAHMHPALGTFAAWTLLIAYFGTATALAAGFQHYVNLILKSAFAVNFPPLLLAILAIAPAAYLAYRDITVSARLMLALEIISVLLISLVILSVLVAHGWHPDMAQLRLQEVTGDKLRVGLVLAIFSLVGFESATSLGTEAKDPLRSIPRAVIWSGVLAGLFFCICSYGEVLSFARHPEMLKADVAPFDILVRDARLPPVLSVVINVGAVICFFSCVLACITAGARILFIMGEQNALPSWLGDAHAHHKTPHSAVVVSALVSFLPLAILPFFQLVPIEIYDLSGTLATLGFLVAYILISIAAPLFLYRDRRLTRFDVAVSAVAILAMSAALAGSVYPVPAPPHSLLPYIFLAIVFAGTACSLLLNQRALKSQAAAELARSE